MRPASPRSHFPFAKDHDHERHRALRLVLVRSRGAPPAGPGDRPRPGRLAAAPAGTSRSVPRHPDRRPRGRARADLAAGAGAGVNYLEHDPKLALPAGAQVGSVAAGMAFVGAWAERRPRPGWRRPPPASPCGWPPSARPTTSGARLPGLRGADRVALEQAARRTAGEPEHGLALGLLGRVAALRALL